MAIPPQVVEKGTDAWNVAQGYTHLKILKPLVEMDKLVKIAIYGCEHIEESQQLLEEFKTIQRIESMNRLIDVLLETIENTDFVMSKDTKEILDELERRINNVKEVIDGIKSIKTDQRTHSKSVTINEEFFNECLLELRAIKKELPRPLNKKNLIFPSSDEIDLDALKSDLIFGG